MKTILLSLSLVTAGCSSIHYTHKNIDGSVDSIDSVRCLWASEGIDAGVSPNGATLKVNKSNTDSAAVAAVAEGVVKGLAASAKP